MLQNYTDCTHAKEHSSRGKVTRISQSGILRWNISAEERDVTHNVDHTPYERQTLKQWPRYTILRGEVVWDKKNGGVLGKKRYGRFLERGVSTLAGPLRPEKDWNLRGF
jgi:hypothetical protein